MVFYENGELSVYKSAIDWLEKNQIKTGDSLKSKIADLFTGISNCLPKDSFNLRSFVEDKTIRNPFLHIKKNNLDDDPETEVVLILGDRTISQLLFLILDFNQNVYKVRFRKEVYCRYEPPEVKFLDIRFGNDLAEIIEKGGGSGISDTYHSYYRFISNKVLEVLKLKASINVNGTLKMRNILEAVSIDTVGGIKADYKCQYWLCTQFDEKIVPSDKLGEWESAKNNCEFKDGLILLNDTYPMYFTWNKNASVFEPDYSKSKLTPDKWNLINNFSAEEAYAKEFFTIYKNEIKIDKKNPTINWIYKRFHLN